MAVCDAVVRNLTAICVAVAVCVKAYGRSYGCCFDAIVSMMVVGLIIIGSLAWDISRKPTYVDVFPGGDDRRPREVCKGGICWHGVALRPPLPQFRLPQRILNADADADA